MACVIKLLKNDEAADAFIDRYMQDYDPRGYGTQARKEVQTDGQVQVTLTRWDSCD